MALLMGWVRGGGARGEGALAIEEAGDAIAAGLIPAGAWRVILQRAVTGHSLMMPYVWPRSDLRRHAAVCVAGGAAEENFTIIQQWSDTMESGRRHTGRKSRTCGLEQRSRAKSSVGRAFSAAVMLIPCYVLPSVLRRVAGAICGRGSSCL